MSEQIKSPHNPEGNHNMLAVDPPEGAPQYNLKVNTDPVYKDLSERVAAAMAAIKSVSKTAFNEHNKYKYASADDIFDMVRPILAEHKLEICMDEISSEVIEQNGKKYILLTYSIGFAGARPERRTFMLQIIGTQTFGAAMTYAVKYWLRSKLLISTGEADLDAEPSFEKTATPSKKVKAKEKVGAWTLSTDGSHRLVYDGAEPRSADAQRALFNALKAQLATRERTDREQEIAQKIFDANETLIANLPGKGTEAIMQQVALINLKTDKGKQNDI